ncbi:probable vacuolar amino acid transporter YPQ1 [Dioscorea cayenensis subsp. rotundata]|uniref:Probable vacuolar amino acid transporter YPQ1 n=1 Tax=Dioscorea cayennensis subsp. rotundata TaxID=55577 RepID=A0AB40CPK8_DIOCR|nr:probable vacuolar amino acid transporter YPQ1 [Dioscorea cayenensis subsp. rotundata]
MGDQIWSHCSSQYHEKEYYYCVKWVEKYFKDCVCNLSSEISFTLGLASLFFWAIAEIPQIITNFHSKSAHGVSLSFILTWILGDIFNLVGCLLEPLTLPTQFYTALLYTSVTVVLLVQTIYYDYWLKWWKNKSFNKDNKEVDERRQHLNADLEDYSTKPLLLNKSTLLSIRTSPKADIYYMSARSLASSGTPPYGSSSYLVAPKSGPSATLAHDSSSEDECDSPIYNTRTRTKPIRILSRSVGYGTFIASSIGLPFQSKALLMEGQLTHEMQINTLGLCLGWIMAAIYMGGRLPQIYLNIKRGSVEGLNPLMFIFALLANATYVGSILVRSIEWERIKANAPWLLDAIVCVLLDLFIIIQFAYYKFMKRSAFHEEDEDEDDESSTTFKKPLII